MIYIFNKNKIISYIIACSFVVMLFAFQENIIVNKDVELVKVSSNATEDTNNINNSNNTNIIINNLNSKNN